MMTVIRCQMCGKLSSDELEVCPFCQARLTPLHVPSSTESTDEFDLGDQPDDLFSADRIGESETGLSDETPLSEDESRPPQNPAEIEVKEWLAALDDEPIDGTPQSDLSSSEKPTLESESDDDDDWITQFRQDDQEIEPQLEIQSEEFPGDEPPDGLSGWLQSFKDGDESDIRSSTYEEMGSNLNDQDDSSDWMDRLQSDGDLPEVVGEPDPLIKDDSAAVTEKEKDAIPEPLDEGILNDSDSPTWLKNLQAETRTFSDDSQPEGTASPDWMTDLQAGSKDTSAIDDPVDREIPAWLREIGADPLSFDEHDTSASDLLEPSDTEAVNDQTFSEVPSDSSEFDQSSGHLDSPMDDDTQEGDASIPEMETEVGSVSFTELDNSQESQVDSSIQGSQIDQVEPSDGNLPDWLQDIGPLTSASNISQDTDLDDQSIDDISGELQSADVPDWLAEIKSNGQTDSDELMTADDAKILDNTTQADLPEWVQDLQPVESMLSNEVIDDADLDQYIESSGPLAGLRGVLPVAAGVAAQHQPNLRRDPSQLTPDQNKQVELINKLLESESEPKAIPKSTKKYSHLILRWLVALLMILAVVLPRVFGFQLLPTSSNYPPELIRSRQVIFEMPYSSPALLVFDYEPAYSAELEAAASSVVADLINKDTRLITVSTSPTGTILSNHLFGVIDDQGIAQREPQVTELGYLPGGSRGIARFAGDPSGTLPFSISGDPIWETQALQDVSTMDDFSLVLLLTENSDTARDWIEQAGGYLGDTPFLMVISAQAEPMIRPYYESDQVDGLVTGLAGGKVYEHTLNISGLGGSYWNSFSFGLLMFEIIILAGGLWSLIVLMLNRKPGQKEEV